MLLAILPSFSDSRESRDCRALRYSNEGLLSIHKGHSVDWHHDVGHAQRTRNERSVFSNINPLLYYGSAQVQKRTTMCIFKYREDQGCLTLDVSIFILSQNSSLEYLHSTGVSLCKKIIGYFSSGRQTYLESLYRSVASLH